MKNRQYSQTIRDYTFSIGLIILEMGLMKPIQSIYDFKKLKID